MKIIFKIKDELKTFFEKEVELKEPKLSFVEAIMKPYQDEIEFRNQRIDMLSKELSELKSIAIETVANMHLEDLGIKSGEETRMEKDWAIEKANKQLGII